MKKTLVATAAGSTVFGTASGLIGGIGISAFGTAVGVGLIPALGVGGLVGAGLYGVYKLGQKSVKKE